MADQNDLVRRLFSVWDDVPADDEDATAAFRRLYRDPVRINGADVSVQQLVKRARMMSAALLGRTTEVLSQVTAGDRTAVAFRMHGRHVGPMDTPLGPISGDGRAVSMQVIDVLTVRDGRISEIWMVADMLGMLASAGAVRPATDDDKGENAGRTDERTVPASSSGA